MRPGRGTRPRSKLRPEHADAEPAMVVAVDRGRWTCAPEADESLRVVAMRARELGRTPIVVGDRVDLVGDLSGRPDALARIVRVEERTSVLRRTADDDDPTERIVVANAEQLVIVTALADPPPRTGFVDRCLVAAYAGGLRPVLCLTKADLANPEPVASQYAALQLPIIVTAFGAEGPASIAGRKAPDERNRSGPNHRSDRQSDELRAALVGRISALIGQSGVGKSTLVNALIPDADRAIGEVSAVGKGRHTTSAALALPLPGGGWVVDTPGVRSFGLAHVTADDVVAAFDDLRDAVADCPRGCGHLGPPTDPECALDALAAAGTISPERLAALRRVLVALHTPAWA